MSHEVTFDINNTQYKLKFDDQGNIDPSIFRLVSKRQNVLRSQDGNFECILRQQQLQDLLDDKEIDLYHRPVKKRLETGLFQYGLKYIVESKDETGRIQQQVFEKLEQAQLEKQKNQRCKKVKLNRQCTKTKKHQEVVPEVVEQKVDIETIIG